jgi:hypothetical protein
MCWFDVFGRLSFALLFGMPWGWCTGCNKWKEGCGNANAGDRPRCAMCKKKAIFAGGYKSWKPKAKIEKKDERDHATNPFSRVETLDRYRCVIYSEFGYNISEIACLLNINRNTVSRIVDQFAKTASVDDKPRSGRKRKITEEQEENIVEWAKKVHTLHAHCFCLSFSRFLSALYACVCIGCERVGEIYNTTGD